MNEATAIESIRIAAPPWCGVCEALLGPVGRPGDRRLSRLSRTSLQVILEALNDNFGEISPAMIAAYRGAFEGAA